MLLFRRVEVGVVKKAEVAFDRTRLTQFQQTHQQHGIDEQPQQTQEPKPSPVDVHKRQLHVLGFEHGFPKIGVPPLHPGNTRHIYIKVGFTRVANQLLIGEVIVDLILVKTLGHLNQSRLHAILPCSRISLAPSPEWCEVIRLGIGNPHG